LQFLNNFPVHLRPFISLALALALVYSVFRVVKKDFLYIIVLILILPGSIPILKNIWQGVLAFIKFLVNTAK
jgi:hypothetical protein